MSRAERRTVPAPPRLAHVLRSAVSDFYYNSWRFLGANLVVGALLIALLLASVATPLALVGVPLLALAVAGTMRMATRLVRDGHADFGDFTETIRRPRLVLVVAAAQTVVMVVLVADLVIGTSIGSAIGTLLVVSALYGLLIAWAYASVAWTLLLDPERDAEPLRGRLRLALVVLVAHPVRVGAVMLLAGVFVLLAAVAIAPLVTFAIALVWLGLARFVLPVADRIEGRATAVVADDAAG